MKETRENATETTLVEDRIIELSGSFRDSAVLKETRVQIEWDEQSQSYRIGLSV